MTIPVLFWVNIHQWLHCFAFEPLFCPWLFCVYKIIIESTLQSHIYWCTQLLGQKKTWLRDSQSIKEPAGRDKYSAV